MSSSQTGDWFDAEAESTRFILLEYGEKFTLAPYRTMQVNFPTGPDTSRKGYDFWAVFDREAKDVAVGMEDVRISTRHLCLTTLVCDVPNIRQGDRLTHIPGARWGDCSPGDLFEITDVRPDGLSGVEIRMTQLGKQKS